MGLIYVREDQCLERSPDNQTQHSLSSVMNYKSTSHSRPVTHVLSAELTEAIGLSIGKTGLEIGVYAQVCSLMCVVCYFLSKKTSMMDCIQRKKKCIAAMSMSRLYFLFHPIDSRARIELAKESMVLAAANHVL